MDEITVKRGTKIEPKDAEKLDRGTMRVGRPTPDRQEVAGQWIPVPVLWCPWCGAMNYITISRDDSSAYIWVTCWNCGGPFKV